MLLLFLAAQAAAAAPPVDITNPAAVVPVLQANGYRAQLDVAKPPPSIESSAAGWKFSILFQNCKDGKECEDLLLQASWETNDEQRPSFEKLNEFNREQRFVKAYLNKEKEPVLEMDIVFTQRRMDATMFKEHLEIWDRSLGQFAEFIGLN